MDSEGNRMEQREPVIFQFAALACGFFSVLFILFAGMCAIGENAGDWVYWSAFAMGIVAISSVVPSMIIGVITLSDSIKYKKISWMATLGIILGIMILVFAVRTTLYLANDLF